MYTSLIDRKGYHRDQLDLNKQLLDDSSQILLFNGDNFLTDSENLYFSLEQLTPVKEYLSKPIYLGQHQQKNYFAFYPTKNHDYFNNLNQQDLRKVALNLDDFQSALLFYCQGLLSWHINHSHCSKCGDKTLMIQSGHARKCQNLACQSQHFPKIEPAVIFLVINHTKSSPQILLARQKSWNEKKFSVLAGFVEAGESLEDAVKREAYEEAGLTVECAEYIASQPWPFPSSLMLGFHCVTSETEINLIDQELAEAYWFSAKELESQVKSLSITLPHRKSIAWFLVNNWFTEQMGYQLNEIT